jgi:putative transposase
LPRGPADAHPPAHNGYRRIRRLLLDEGWDVSVKRVYRIWLREGLKVPKKQPKRGRLWLNDGSCIRLRPERPNHVWSYDFLQDRTEDGRRFRMPEFVARNVREWLGRIGVTTLYIEPGSPWENGYCESFNSKLCDALRNRFPPPLRGCFGIRVLFSCPSSHRFVPGAL